MATTLEKTTQQIKALADATRLRLLAACDKGELTVNQLASVVGLSQPAVSRHLKKLCDAGLLLRFQERHFVFYRTPAAGPERRLVQAVFNTLDSTETTLAADQAALRDILDERAERAALVLDRHRLDERAAPAIDDERFAAAVLRLVDTKRIGNLLDIGTGTGRILRLLGAHAKSAVGIDIAPDMLLLARQAVAAAGLGSVMVRHGDMYRLPYPDATFDTVTLDQVVSVAEHPRRAIVEAARILRPGGQMLLVDAVAADAASDIEQCWRDGCVRGGCELTKQRSVAFGETLLRLAIASRCGQPTEQVA